MLKYLSIWAAKAAMTMSKLLGKKGSSVPGFLAFRIYPDILKHLSKELSGEIVAVLGTNGKTTTNNMITDILEADGKRVVTNRVGANMLPGIATAFLDAVSWTGRLRYDAAALEIDEASAKHVFAHLTPDKIVITNLFRDQLDRYGEIEQTAALMKEALLLAPDAMLFLNGDDPMTAEFGRMRENVRYFGVDTEPGMTSDEAKGSRYCAVCGGKLRYEVVHYSQLGKYACEVCGFKRPEPDFLAKEVSLNEGIAFLLQNDEKSFPVTVSSRGFYNVYNILAAASVALSSGVAPLTVCESLKKYRPQIGRMESFSLKKPTVLNLAKNPAGMNQAISTVLSDHRQKNLMVMLNDGAGDGTDISWIWDVDFERFLTDEISTIVLSGTRKEDIAVRLKYAGLPRERFTVVSDTEEAILKTLSGTGDIAYLLVNYTALFRVEALLKKMEEGEAK